MIQLRPVKSCDLSSSLYSSELIDPSLNIYNFEITNFNKKTSTIFLFFLFLFSWSIPSFANYPEPVSMGLRDSDCGTLNDPNYSAAFFALQDALEYCFPGPQTNNLSRVSLFFQKLVTPFLMLVEVELSFMKGHCPGKNLSVTSPINAC